MAQRKKPQQSGGGSGGEGAGGGKVGIQNAVSLTGGLSTYVNNKEFGGTLQGTYPSWSLSFINFSTTFGTTSPTYAAPGRYSFQKTLSLTGGSLSNNLFGNFPYAPQISLTNMDTFASPNVYLEMRDEGSVIRHAFSVTNRFRNKTSRFVYRAPDFFIVPVNEQGATLSISFNGAGLSYFYTGGPEKGNYQGFPLRITSPTFRLKLGNLSTVTNIYYSLGFSMFYLTPQ